MAALLPAAMVTVVLLLGLVVYLLFFGSPAAKPRPGTGSGNGRQVGQSAAELANRAEAARATGDCPHLVEKRLLQRVLQLRKQRWINAVGRL